MSDFREGYIDGYCDAATDADTYSVAGCGCVSDAKVFGLQSSIRRAKYPMVADVKVVNSELTNGIVKLAQSGRGEGHDQFLTGIIVQFDLTFSNKAWVECERYHFIDFVSSQSTMHRMMRFDLDKAYNEFVDKQIVDRMKTLVGEYNQMLNEEVTDEALERKYLEVLYSNPAGFRLTAGMTTNYRQLKTSYHQRKSHRLPEWREFCAWIETLPSSELITGKRKESD